MSPERIHSMKNKTTISMKEAVQFWFQLGWISFGGPAGQIAIMHDELVTKKKWISEKRFLHALNYCMVLPGPEAQQLATYIGWLMHRSWGGIIAGSLFVLPSFFIISGLAWFYLVNGHTPLVSGIFYGIKPAVTAIVLFAAWRIGSKALKNNILWTLAALSFIASFIFHIPFPVIVGIAALTGIIGGKMRPKDFQAASHHGGAPKEHIPAVIDDTTPIPEHARFNKLRFIFQITGALLLWLAVTGLLIYLFGWQSTASTMGIFFTKAALLTFGGAYAVLPYVYQGGVEQYHWLSATQMMDGLALGETTPGPLIMIVTFVGFLGGWNNGIFSNGWQVASSFIGAGIATFFTFLPSFLFILVGGPWVEKTRGDIKFTAPLTAITAAVVGVIVNLAVFFAKHVLWPNEISGHPDWIALVIGSIAFIAMYRFKKGIIPVVAVSAIAGYLIKSIMNLI